MYGTQALRLSWDHEGEFENDVNMYGTQAVLSMNIPYSVFENDVNMYGTQARRSYISSHNQV